MAQNKREVSSVKLDTWLNGEPLNSVSIHDRGLQYGDGFFTTILVRNQQVLNWPAHWRRIEKSCEALLIPLLDKTQLQTWVRKALSEYLQANFQTDCVLKIMITRGSGGIGYQMPEPINPNCIFVIKPAPAVNEALFLSHNEPIATMVANQQAGLLSQPGLVGLKSLNRLENVLARTEIANQGFAEAIMLNSLENVVCGTQSNLFIIQGENIATPRLDVSGVEGTTRYQLLFLLETLGYAVQEADLKLEDVLQADELFFSNAVRGIQAVDQLLDVYFQTLQTQKIHQAWSDWQQQNAISLNQLN
ncbi:4-amino-4-deoxychorismate lyase [Thiomicrorhabdus immobilis]|uniref:Aminodeoxychorismate lyase n=1 Tax=Thiomicrorhabdus immobilis TaxID=2791037 RepID=A0ABM7MCG0_9GAMM|nr:aminodeoxychorismate lyase [Thiomicrorhabdus immobilis]BCN93060.1 4-amino-4-deoxychorismate lyase [Thiomicrorhabdus immobilis]